MEYTELGRSGLKVAKICLGTMTFGRQVSEADAHALMDHAVARGVDFLDTAEMYPVPPSAETHTHTESIIGRWLAARPGMRQRIVLASKVAGPVRGYQWIRNASPDLTGEDIIRACEDSLRRLQTDYLDLYQIHWPVRNVPMFGAIYFDPARDRPVSSIHEQLDALGRLVRDGKVRAIGLSNETPYGVAEFVRVAEQHGLPRIASVQNPYCLINRSVENGLDETMYRYGVSLLAYSPLGFGLLTGKYDDSGIEPQGGRAPGRMALFESMRKQRWGRPEALAAARRYNALAREHGMTPARMALAFCYTKWQVASTIIGVTNREQLDEDIDAWGTTLSPEVLAEIDRIRWEIRDPAQ
ncbi:aldo/keto reductase [Caldimonas thermodepolymerans]|jgi:aryl-alcohol dehydrogenase-like predicted oxidoreductase|uniref:Aldo/keto reductase n=1 Tax=Caldimonas thermodepolymerans TaxID=215580 RepID=A0A2S5T4A6_9BURK|nr:aldo/keto reductase [Caldimonas thermodepolymerans]PPE69769.1 aldo/keto reductase [Caldimonas thermodepolymerans]QPC32604.1 aldo/keto reductase [Caldimonas thermodepolymerans]RDI03351.1 aryl-alcohol dehydrogenase-like predicted oxidoreductase [Caldimonas thermodepolymerans]